MKKIVALLIMCFVMSLAGCGEREPVEVPKPDTPPQVEATKSFPIENAQLAENFQLVCDQVGIEADQIANWEQSEDWIGGTTYLFDYKEAKLRALFGVDSVVEAIMIGEQEMLYSYRSGAYKFSDFVPDSNIVNQIETLSQNLIKKECGLPENAMLPITEASATRSLNIYNYFGYMDMTEADGSEVSMAFVLCFEQDEAAKELHLRYFTLGESVIQDTLSEITVPEAMPSVKQTRAAIPIDEDQILIVEGELGSHGKEFSYTATEKGILYYIPAGTYLVESLVPGCEVIVQNEDTFVDANGYTQHEVVSKTTFASIGDKHEITVKEGEHIITSFFAKVVLDSTQ